MRPMNPQVAILKLIAAGWTPAQIAAHASISVATVSRIRNGLLEPTYRSGAALVVAARAGRKPPRRAS